MNLFNLESPFTLSPNNRAGCVPSVIAPTVSTMALSVSFCRFAAPPVGWMRQRRPAAHRWGFDRLSPLSSSISLPVFARGHPSHSLKPGMTTSLQLKYVLPFTQKFKLLLFVGFKALNIFISFFFFLFLLLRTLSYVWINKYVA